VGSNPNVYITIKNTFGLKETYQINSQTFYSVNDRSPVAKGSYSEFNKDLMDFNKWENMFGSPKLARAKTFNTFVIETMKALLELVSGSNLGNYSDDSTCGRSTDLFGSFTPTINYFLK
tara:strand:+ start:175 stop:531 length:357 start_codon:yes stop_codon:yes gene_type:complete